MWYIFRHGETFQNVKRDMVMGHTKNIFLTFNGVLQTHLNGLKLSKTGEDFAQYKFICSPLERTIHTCQLLMDTIGLRFDILEKEKLLKERTKGIFDGLKKTYIEEKYPQELELMKKESWNQIVCEGYETHKMIFIKMAEFIEKYKNEENLVIVAHEGVCQSLMYLLEQSKNNTNLKQFVDNITDEEGNEIVKTMKKVAFNQNYFYSWDGDKLIKI